MSAFVQMIPLYVSLFCSKKQWDATYAGFSKDSLPKVDRNEKQRDAHLTSLARLFIQSTQRFLSHVNQSNLRNEILGFLKEISL